LGSERWYILADLMTLVAADSDLTSLQNPEGF